MDAEKEHPQVAHDPEASKDDDTAPLPDIYFNTPKKPSFLSLSKTDRDKIACFVHSDNTALSTEDILQLPVQAIRRIRQATRSSKATMESLHIEPAVDAFHAILEVLDYHPNPTRVRTEAEVAVKVSRDPKSPPVGWDNASWVTYVKSLMRQFMYGEEVPREP